MRTWHGVLAITAFITSTGVALAASTPESEPATATCSVAYARGGESLGTAYFSGHVGSTGGIAISQDFDLAGVQANLHVYLDPSTRFASINYFHAPTDSVLNSDTYVTPGKEV